MSDLVAGPLLVALVAAIATLLARPWPRLQRGLSLGWSVAYLIVVAILFETVRTSGPLVYQLSGWPAPYGITLIADELATLMLALTAVVSLAALAYSALSVDAFGQSLSYHPLFHFMLAGVSGSFLTGDIFNLFVWFEVMLMASYVLVAFYSGPQQTRASLLYLVLNLVGSGVMLLAIGGLYATIGTLNMADMSRRLANAEQYGIDPAPVLGLSALLFAVFALKAGIVPFQFWVPAAYRAAPAPVTAVLAGVVKKVGVYAIVRLYFTVFAAASLPVSLPGLSGRSFLAFYGPVLFLMGSASIIVGGVGAIDRDDLDGMLAYSSIGQVGFIILPLAVSATAVDPAVRALGVTATLVYAINHGLAKGTLFLVSGTIYAQTGTRTFDDLGGLAGQAPVLSASFFLGALALVGVPPLTGFFGKLLVFDVAGRAGAWIALAVALMGAVLTIAYVTRAWNRGFWGTPGSAVTEGPDRRDLVAVVATLALTLIVLGVGFDPLLQAAESAAAAALDRTGYVDAVLEVNA